MPTIVRYEPFLATGRWPRPAFPRLAAEPTRSRLAANLYQTTEAYWVEVPLPAVKPEDVQVTVQENVITLKARRDWARPEGAQSIWQGFAPGSWEHTFTLPGEVDADKVEAHLEHGLLRLQLPKAAHSRPRQITVNGVADAPAKDAPAKDAPAKDAPAKDAPARASRPAKAAKAAPAGA
jgi:HSP20 family protein